MTENYESPTITMLFEEFELAEIDGATLEKYKPEMTDSEIKISRKVNPEF